MTCAARSPPAPRRSGARSEARGDEELEHVLDRDPGKGRSSGITSKRAYSQREPGHTYQIVVSDLAPGAQSGRFRTRSILEAIVDDCYRRGENRERQAVLRTLPLLPEPERFVSIGIDACRTSIQPLFEAIACENPYPATHFEDHSFNQIVLKAMFVKVALERVIGLQDRRTPELA